MTRRSTSIDSDYFEDLYQRKGDPWEFETSPYEQEKYAATLAALPRAQYRHGLEIGCSIGVLTRLLARRCGQLVAMDVSETALDAARARCQGLHVTFLKGRIPQDWPAGTADLIVFSEVLYYLDRADLHRTAALARESVARGGTILLVHYLGETDYPLSGDDAAALFMQAAGLPAADSLRTPDYRIDVLLAD